MAYPFSICFDKLHAKEKIKRNTHCFHTTYALKSFPIISIYAKLAHSHSPFVYVEVYWNRN